MASLFQIQPQTQTAPKA